MTPEKSLNPTKKSLSQAHFCGLTLTHLDKATAVGIVVGAFVQEPRKETLPRRGLFTQTVALLPRSLDDAAPAHRINPNEPGSGYVIAADGTGAWTGHRPIRPLQWQRHEHGASTPHVVNPMANGFLDRAEWDGLTGDRVNPAVGGALDDSRPTPNLRQPGSGFRR
jgi:hypothetical protein